VITTQPFRSSEGTLSSKEESDKPYDEVYGEAGLFDESLAVPNVVMERILLSVAYVDVGRDE